MNEPAQAKCPVCDWRGPWGAATMGVGVAYCPKCGHQLYSAKHRCSVFDPLELYLPEGWTITPGEDTKWTVESPDQATSGFFDQWEALHYAWAHSLWPDSETNRLKRAATTEKQTP